jgi:hypothetical protein
MNRPPDYLNTSGLGFLAVAAAAPAAGPAAPLVIGASVIGSAISKILGFGPPSSATNYRPPANSKDIMVEFPAKGQNIAFDMNDIGTALARGNKEADLRSYYSAFLSGSVDAGASPAAKRAILDAVNKYGVSVRDIAETLLTQAGVRKIVSPIQPPAASQGFLATTATVEKPPVLPAVGTVLDSILDLLKGGVKPAMPVIRPLEIGPAPPPPPPAGSPAPGSIPAQSQQNQAQAAIQAGLIKAAQKAAAALLKARQKVADEAQQFGCDPGAQYYDPVNNQCIFLATCPEGQYFEPSQNRCVIPQPEEDLTGFLDSFGSIGGIPIWLLILLGLVVVRSQGGGGRTVSFRRKR